MRASHKRSRLARDERRLPCPSGVDDGTIVPLGADGGQGRDHPETRNAAPRPCTETSHGQRTVRSLDPAAGPPPAAAAASPPSRQRPGRRGTGGASGAHPGRLRHSAKLSRRI